MSNKQSSVEWLIEQIQNNIHHTIRIPSDTIEQAKAMEKEQIIDAVNLPKEERWYDAKLYNSSGEQYYNKTYGQNRD
jgi:hypothetical protein